MKVFVVGPQKGYASWLKAANLVDDIKDAEIVMFTGGEDVHPSFYNEKVGAYTSFNLDRDIYEAQMFAAATELQKPIIGICRGSQLTCAMSGGRLVQHQTNPGAYHDITTWDGQELPISSTHHQAQYPYELPDTQFKLIAWTEGASKVHLDGTNKEISDKPFKEAEIVYYPKTNALGIQGHPEWMDRRKYGKTLEFLDGLVEKLLNNKL